MAPDSRIVYVDNNPIVLAHARALLASGPQGMTAYLDADIRDPESVLSHPVTRGTLDFTKPIALILVAVLHFVPDEDEPKRIVQTLVDALPPGSYLVASHATAEHNPEGLSGAWPGSPDLYGLNEQAQVSSWRAYQSLLPRTPGSV